MTRELVTQIGRVYAIAWVLTDRRLIIAHESAIRR